MVESSVKVYVSSLSGNKEVKKRQQRVMMILESKNIQFTVVDITEPTQEKEKDFMQANATEKGITVSDTDPRHPLPPQIFNGTEYCGDYNGFELANECDTLEQFLKLPAAPEAAQQNGSTVTTDVAPAPAAGETNGSNGDTVEVAADAEEKEADVPEPVEAAPSEPVDAPADDAPATEPSESAADGGAADDAGGDAAAD